MSVEELVRACLDELGESDEIGIAGEVAEANSVALLGTEGVAAVLVGYAVGEQDADRERGLDLFEALIREARQDEKGRGRMGAMFLDEAARTMHALVAADRVDPPATHDLARAYARADEETPPALVQCLIGQMDELTQAGRLPFDPNSEIERLSAVMELDKHYLHRKLEERIGVLPEELRAAFAYEVACREEAACGRIAMYWLLDDTAEVRLGAAEGLRERAHRAIVEPVSAALVPLIRNWMPPDAARTLLDEALGDPAEAAVVLEHDVAGPGRRGLLEEHAHPARRRRRAARRLAVGRAPAFGDLVEARGLLGEAGRHIPVAAQRQQGGAQTAVALVAFGDQAAPVGVHRAHTPDPVVHGGVADQRADSVRGRTSRAPAEPGCGGPPHDPSPPAIPPAGIAPSGRGL